MSPIVVAVAVLDRRVVVVRLVVGTREVNIVVVHAGVELAALVSFARRRLLMQIILLFFQLLYVHARHHFVVTFLV